jgi:hypothetical protein
VVDSFNTVMDADKTPLDATEELQRDDFVRLMHDVIELRKILVEPNRGHGGLLPTRKFTICVSSTGQAVHHRAPP